MKISESLSPTSHQNWLRVVKVVLCLALVFRPTGSVAQPVVNGAFHSHPGLTAIEIRE